MYPIRDDFGANCFIGTTLYELCLNANQIRLLFDSGCKIVLEGKLVLRNASNGESASDANTTPVIVTPQSPNLDLFLLIEAQVASAQLDRNRMNLTLEFSDGQAIELIGDEPYECYKIQIGGAEIVV